jgi:hypothetical protein
MKQNIKIVVLFCTAIIFISCAGQLTKEKAARILRKSYTGNYNPDEAGGSHTVIDAITIDSIHQAGDTALVFYQISGRVENGSKYLKNLKEGELEEHFKRGIFGWKEN